MDKIAIAWFGLIVIFSDRFSSIAGQGNRGVIVNNQKLDSSSGIDLSSTVSTTTMSTPFVSIETTTKRRKNYRNPSEIYVTIPNFRPSTTSRRPNEKTTPSVANLPKLPDFIGIATILNQNESDFDKIGKIVKKLNVTGGVTQINVINVSSNNQTKTHRKTTNAASAMGRKNATYVHPSTKHDSAKDSKELKVQFVLDCDLKDALNRDEGTLAPVIRRPTPNYNYIQYQRPPVTLRPLQLYYPNYMQNAFNQQIPMKKVRVTTRRPHYTYQYRPAPQMRPVKTLTKAPTKPKTKVKNVYVDPPGVAALSNAFEGAYDFFENALIDTVKKPLKQKPQIISPAPITNKIAQKVRRRRPPIVKRSTERVVKNYKPTPAPVYANTEKQKLTTQIHVTSEYVGKEPIVVKKGEDTSEQYGDGDDDDKDDDDDYEDDYDDDDEDDEDDGDYGMSFGGFDVNKLKFIHIKFEV